MHNFTSGCEVADMLVQRLDFGPGVRATRARTYDPALADLFITHGRAWLDQLGQLEPWDAVLALETAPHRILAEEAFDRALTVAADSIDMKSP